MMQFAVAAVTILVPFAPLFAAIEPGVLLSYRGSVAKLGEDGAPREPEKNFDLLLWVASHNADGTETGWLIEESGRGGWSWSDRFGHWQLDADFLPVAGSEPALFYDRDGRHAVIPLPVPVVQAPVELAQEASWEQGKTRFVVEGATELEGRSTWRIQVSNALGRKRVVWLERGNPLAVGIDERVFMGQGEEYQLQLRLVSREQLTADELAAWTEGLKSLVDLREKLDRPVRAEQPELTDQGRAELARRLPAATRATRDTPLVKIVEAARKDLEAQCTRADRVAELVTKFQGRAVEPFVLSGTAGESFSDADLKGKVTVLHFWEYRDEPLKEPYGQIGYLDFLYDKRKGKDVRIHGVAVDSRLGEEATRAAATRRVKKLIGFMNLSYPVLLDDGAVLKQFGDPRLVGSQLPLFVVIGPDGKIEHYFVGCYEVDRDAGLKVLDQVVTDTLKKHTP